MHTKNLSIKIESDSGNNNINFMNKDTMPLDTPVKPAYDRRNASHKLLLKLDTREGSEYDKRRNKSEYDTERALSLENDKRKNESEYNNIEPSSLSFPCLTRESSGKMDHCFSGYLGGSTNMTNRDNTSSTIRMISQSGRSMVEMLGVLAVIGVLSIGGIMGYSYGMDKYRANETTNQIMLRAIDLMTQASNNNAELSLAAWENEQTQYDFANEDYTEDGLIAFDMGTNTPLPKSVCEMVFDSMSSMAVQIDINGARAESNDACTEENEMTFYFEGQIGTRCIPECAENEYCYNGICFKGGVPDTTKYFDRDNICSSDTECGACRVCASDKRCKNGPSNDTCTIDGSPGVCRGGECYPKGDGCTTNDDCTEPGTYCASTNPSSSQRFQEGEIGSCVPLDFVRKEIAGEAYYISNLPLSWWDAEYACDAIGSNIKMVTVDDLITENDGSKWSGDEGYHTPTALLRKLSVDYLWTKNVMSDGESMIRVSNLGFVVSTLRDRDDAHAVCY